MAEYDNLLAEVSVLPRAGRASAIARRLAFALRTLRTEETELTAAVRALQTENTELRAERDDNYDHYRGQEKLTDATNQKLAAAERVITEAKKTYDLQCDTEPVRDDYMDEGAYRAHHWWWTVLGPVLSSYPLGEGQTQQGDERG